MAKAIMIQGTMSNAGKSLITAGLCRVLMQDGYRVSPFKSQNMALNSFITNDGHEIGRAQAVQAEAAGIKPSALMNPILLKPTDEKGAQLIVNGNAVSNMSAVDYFKYKTKLIPDIMKAYNNLSEKYDIIVIEGAGSPAEINLKERDIVNMGMARLAKAPVLLVGDIDRGGVFAQLYGTVALLEQNERDMIKGLIINKFRGDLSILNSGLSMIEDMTGIPVIGTVPYSALDIDDEDSLSERINNTHERRLIDIAVIRLPYISNFTDFNPFGQFSYVSVRYVKAAAELGEPDMIVLPGTKSTAKDLLWLRESGLESAVLTAHRNGAVLFGICGGFQMLGQEINDPLGTESEISNIKGLGLLPVCTVFEADKIQKRIKGVIDNIDGIFCGLSGKAYEGYEIHMGCAEGFSGVIMSKGNVYGSYAHGIFDAEGVAEEIVSALCRARGVKPCETHFMDIRAYKEEQYDKLAGIIRASMDMGRVYKIINEGL